MLGKPLLSIILPIYNVEKYLRPSLDSILVQDTGDCEILLINDGSKDSSLAIMREYADRYTNIRIIDKQNEGVSATRNRGLAECKGEYCYFMDADDSIHPQLIALVRNEIQQNHPDLVVWDFTTFYTKPHFAQIPENVATENVDNNNKEAFNYLMANGSAVSLWNKVIRRSLLDDIIRIDPTMTYGEDMFFSWKTILLADTIRYIRLPLYYYLQSGSGATNRFHPDLYEHYRRAFDDIRNFVEQQGIGTEEVIRSIDYHFVCRIPTLTSMEMRAPYSQKEQLKHLAHVLEDEYIKRGLQNHPELNGKLFQLARSGNVVAMLRTARIAHLKARLLYPIKKLIK